MTKLGFAKACCIGAVVVLAFVLSYHMTWRERLMLVAMLSCAYAKGLLDQQRIIDRLREGITRQIYYSEKQDKVLQTLAERLHAKNV